MTIREQIERRTRHYARDLKVTMVMFVLGNVGMFFLLESDRLMSSVSPRSPWMFIPFGVVAVLYGGGGFGALVFTLLLALTARCPNCSRRFRTLRKDWDFCPFCGTGFDQVLEGRR